jgi:hypothetical protein
LPRDGTANARALPIIQYSPFFAYLRTHDDFPDVKIYVISLAAEVHIRKVYLTHFFAITHIDGHAVAYEAGRARGARDSALYQSIVEPYFLAFDHACPPQYSSFKPESQSAG